MIMWTGVLLGILFMIYGRVQQPAAAVSGSFHGTNEDISVGCDATRRLNRKDVIPWDASPSGLIVKHAHQSFHNWNATGRKEGRNFAYGHTLSRRLFFPSSACDVGEGGDRVSLVRRSHYWTGIELPVVVGVTLFESNGSHLNLWLD